MELLTSKTLSIETSTITFPITSTDAPLKLVYQRSSGTLPQFYVSINGIATSGEMLDASGASITVSAITHVDTAYFSEIDIINGRVLFTIAGDTAGLASMHTASAVSGVTEIKLTTIGWPYNFKAGDRFALYQLEDGTASNTYVPPLNSSSHAVYASGYRLLYDGYTGPLIQIKRSSDSATMKVYPDINGDIDYASMADFVGSANAVEVTRYDQIGSNHLSGSGHEPTIAASGVFSVKNGHPTSSFNGSAWLVNNAATGLPTGSSARTMVTVGQYSSLASDAYMLCYGQPGGTDPHICDLGHYSGTNLMLDTNGATIFSDGADLLLHQYAWQYDAGEQLLNSEILKDNVVQPLTTTSTSVPDTINQDMTIGSYLTGASKITGYLPEAIIFDTNKDLTDLFTNQKGYWGIL